jgi:hypothetical protein
MMDEWNTDVPETQRDISNHSRPSGGSKYETQQIRPHRMGSQPLILRVLTV